MKEKSSGKGFLEEFVRCYNYIYEEDILKYGTPISCETNEDNNTVVYFKDSRLEHQEVPVSCSLPTKVLLDKEELKKLKRYVRWSGIDLATSQYEREVSQKKLFERFKRFSPPIQESTMYITYTSPGIFKVLNPTPELLIEVKHCPECADWFSEPKEVAFVNGRCTSCFIGP